MMGPVIDRDVVLQDNDNEMGAVASPGVSRERLIAHIERLQSDPEFQARVAETAAAVASGEPQEEISLAEVRQILKIVA